MSSKIDADPVHSHGDFSRMIGFAASLFPETDFRWLMRMESAYFLHDVRMLFRAISPRTGKWLEPHSEPRFVSRSRTEAAAAKKGGAK